MTAYTIKSRRAGHVVRVEGDGIGMYMHLPSGSERDCIRGAIQVHESLVIATMRDETSVPFAPSVIDAGTSVFVRGASVSAWRIHA